MRVLLCRHGETPWNKAGRYQGQMDIPLSDVGEGQARALGERLKELPITKAMASPLSRAKRTAELALGDRAGMLTVHKGLMEIAHGEWEGKLAAEIRASDPARLEQWRDAPHAVKMPGGECMDEVLERSWQAFAEITEGLGAEDTLLLVAHDAVNRALLCKVLGLPMARLWAFRQAPATLNLLEGETVASLQVVRLNDASHVAGLFGEAVHRAL
ncbi:MAG: histidine phosphatase family protein [Holophagaceae bacterium]|nr:histidine phosphatase family protein [Holophagaceae bacterium]